MKKLGSLAFVLIFVGIFLIWGIGSYNGLVSSKENIENTRAQIETDLQRRMDLIPNLVNTVKGYATHEKDVFDNIANARAKMSGAKDLKDKATANDELDSAISRLMVVVENYPELKADKAFIGLMDQLEGTENRIKVARNNYNNAVKEYNVKIKKFPRVLIAKLFGFDPEPYFTANPDAINAPNVNF